MFDSNASTEDRLPPGADAGVAVMAEEHLEQVLEIERRSFRRPWRREHFLFEIRENERAINRAVVRRGRVLAYACAWTIEDELRINNIAVHPAHRREGLAVLLLDGIILEARVLGCRVACLEVRPSNTAALELYGRYGFVEVGRRRGYYELDGEDALLMEARLAPPGTPSGPVAGDPAGGL